MSPNLTMSPDLGKEDWDPDVITRMIFIGPGAHVSEQEIVSEFHMLGLPLTIKNTCYGSMISGKSEHVYKAIEEIRKLEREIEDKLLSIMKDGNTKRMEELKLQRKRSVIIKEMIQVSPFPQQSYCKTNYMFNKQEIKVRYNADRLNRF